MNYDKYILDFLNEFEEYQKNGTVPKTANQDLKHFFQNRFERLKRLNISEEFLFDKSKLNIYKMDFPFLVDFLKFNKMKYCISLDRKKTYFYNKSIISKDNKFLSYYFIVDDINKKNDQMNTICNCPNCGALSSIMEFEKNGCSYCHTKFMISDIFPNISNYYSYDSGIKSAKNNSRDFKIILLIIIIIGLLSCGLFYMISNELNIFSRIFNTIVGFFLGIIGGSFIIFPIWFILFFTKMVSKSTSNLDVAPKLFKSKKIIDNTMKQYNPNFSYSYFESKVLNLVRNILMDDNRSLSPQNKIENLDSIYNNLIDITYRQVIELNSINETDGYLNIQVSVYLKNDYFISNEIKTINESFVIDMKHNQKFDIDIDYSLSAVKCHNCGASFDATHHNNCIYCGSEYHADNDDWIVTNIKRK